MEPFFIVPQFVNIFVPDCLSLALMITDVLLIYVEGDINGGYAVF